MVRTSFASWQELYHEGYFHGSNSGYPVEGYERAHPTWEAYLRFIREARGDGLRWLDLGCAYGYLVGEARAHGMRACGLDVSDYALRYTPELRGKLGLAMAEVLPVRSESCDVVTAFDLAEHLETPQAMLREAWRVLRPGGLFFLGTPDPLHFHRPEETHFSQQPPSTWLGWLRDLGFSRAFRFYAEEYNLEVLALKPPLEEAGERLLAAFGKDYFGAQPDILRQVAHPELRAVLRKGWSPLSASRSFTTSASLYLLNEGDRPLAVRLELRLALAKDLQVIVDERRVAYLSGERGLAEFSILPGGHEITLLAGEYQHVDVLAVTVETSQSDFASHNLQLPFDQYQRYRSLREAVTLLRCHEERPLRVLDVGGYPGQILGFLPAEQVTVIDLQGFDSRHSVVGDGLTLPYAEGEFDVVTSVDVLEHLEPERRPTFLAELWRVASRQVIIAGPFESRAVSQAEEILSEFIKFRSRASHRYLGEHAQYGLPTVGEVEEFFGSQGAADLVRLPNTPLTVWLLTMGAYFYLDANPRLNHVSRKLTGFLNELSPSLDASDHYYRQLLLVSKAPLSQEQHAAVQRLVHTTHEKPFDFSPVLTMLSLFYFQLQEEKERDYQQRLDHSANQYRATIQSHQQQVERVMADRRSWQEHAHQLEIEKVKLEERLLREANAYEQQFTWYQEQMQRYQEQAQQFGEQLARYEEQGPQYKEQLRKYEEQAIAMRDKIDELNEQRHLAQVELVTLQRHYERLQQHDEELTQQLRRLEHALAQKDAQLLHQAEVVGQQAQQINAQLRHRLARLLQRLGARGVAQG